MKYLKKTTALLLSVLLLFSAMVTGFTVTADDKTATITVAAVEAQASANVDVPVKITTTAGVEAVIFTVTVDEGLTVNDTVYGEGFAEQYKDVYNNEYTFALTADGVTGEDIDLVTFNVTVPAEAEAETAYAITVSNATAAGWDAETGEFDIVIATNNGSVTVLAEDEECDHANVNTDDAVSYVEFTETGITYYENCPDCGEKAIISTDSSEVAAIVAGKALDQTYYSAVNVKEGTTFNVNLDIPEGYDETDVMFAYVDGDKILANGLVATMQDGNPANGEYPFVASCVDGVATFDVDFAGTFIAFIPKNVDDIKASSAAKQSTNFSAESEVTLIFVLPKAGVRKDGVDVFSSYYGVITHHAYTIGDATNTENIVNKTVYVEEKYSTDSGYGFPYSVAPMAMGDDVDCAFYGVRDGIDYFIREKMAYSMVAYAAGSAGFNNSTTDGKKLAYKALLADMLYYGNEVQEYFGYRTNAMIGESSVADYITEWKSEHADAFPAELDTVENVQDPKLFRISKAFSAESRTELDYIVNITRSDNNDFLNNYGLEEVKNMTYQFEVDGVMQDNVIVYSEEDTDNFIHYEANKRYMIVCDALTSIDYNKIVKLHVQYGGRDVLTSEYSVNHYCSEKWTSTGAAPSGSANSNGGQLARALYYYGVSAEGYFLYQA